MFLKFLNGPYSGRLISLEQGGLIGSHSSCQLRLPEPDPPAVLAQVLRRGTTWIIRSAEGVTMQVNDQEYQEAELNHGDTLTFTGSTLRLSVVSLVRNPAQHSQAGLSLLNFPVVEAVNQVHESARRLQKGTPSDAPSSAAPSSAAPSSAAPSSAAPPSAPVPSTLVERLSTPKPQPESTASGASPTPDPPPALEQDWIEPPALAREVLVPWMRVILVSSGLGALLGALVAGLLLLWGLSTPPAPSLDSPGAGARDSSPLPESRGPSDGAHQSLPGEQTSSAGRAILIFESPEPATVVLTFAAGSQSGSTQTPGVFRLPAPGKYDFLPAGVSMGLKIEPPWLKTTSSTLLLRAGETQTVTLKASGTSKPGSGSSSGTPAGNRRDEGAVREKQSDEPVPSLPLPPREPDPPAVKVQSSTTAPHSVNTIRVRGPTVPLRVTSEQPGTLVALDSAPLKLTIYKKEAVSVGVHTLKISNDEFLGARDLKLPITITEEFAAQVQRRLKARQEGTAENPNDPTQFSIHIDLEGKRYSINGEDSPMTWK